MVVQGARRCACQGETMTAIVHHLDRCAWWCADCETGDCAVTRMPMQVAAAGHAADYPGHEVIVEVNGEVVAAWNVP